MKKNQDLTWDDIKAMFAETGRLFKETDRKLKKENALWRKEMKERDEKRDEKARRKQEERDERDEKARQERDKSSKEMWAYLKELGREVGGIAHNNGEMAEEYFYNAFRRNMSFVNENFDNIKKNLSCDNGTLAAEFDLVLFNGKSAALIEIKYNAKPDNIEIDTLISRVEVFRILFPEYAHYNIYLGVAAMSFKKDLVWRLHRAGIATIRPVGKKMVVYDKNVRVF